jgi:GxxExxY protein
MRTLIKPESVFFPDLSYKINGALFSVHNKLGKYCSERQYADALETELKKINVRYVREFAIPASFEGEHKRRNVVDFLVEDRIIVELKAKRKIAQPEYGQLLRYLVASNKRLGILANFHADYLYPKRVINTNGQLAEEHS